MEHISFDLIVALEQVYKPCGFVADNFVKEQESQEYSACTFTLNKNIIIFRAAKITPIKVGQFVAVWKRISNGPIMPYDIADRFDFLVVSVRADNNFGQFVFPRHVLFEHGLLSEHAKGGKRAMRIYPPWDIADSSQAKKTQAWQSRYFFAIQPMIEIDRVKKLFLLDA